MQTLTFTILGNQLGPKKNPVPYTRVVGTALWTKPARKYNAWKEFVVGKFLVAYPNYARTLLQHGKPIPPAHAKRMDLKIYYGSKTHADNDNIFKGIADALFANDKDLDGSFVGSYDTGQPRVEVSIELHELPQTMVS